MYLHSYSIRRSDRIRTVAVSPMAVKTVTVPEMTDQKTDSGSAGNVRLESSSPGNWPVRLVTGIESIGYRNFEAII